MGERKRLHRGNGSERVKASKTYVKRETTAEPTPFLEFVQMHHSLPTQTI